MNPFQFERSSSSSEAILRMGKNSRAKFIGGGTNLIDLMKEGVESSDFLLDVNHVGMNEVLELPGGRIRIGASVTNSDAAYSGLVEERFPLLRDAILAGASPQLRNMATCGGNLLQRTRCYYFYDLATACNKRENGSGCDAIAGNNRIHALFGASDACIAVHPSDMCVALATLNAEIHVLGPNGPRVIRIADFHRLPGNDPTRDNTLSRDELIIAIELPPSPLNHHYHYAKVRDRSSYAFALISAAVGMNLEAGKIQSASIAMGGVAHKPWRDSRAEKLLIGKRPEIRVFRDFSEAFFKSARGLGHNNFKIELGKRTLVRALEEASLK
ncbi:MAG: xanthine dehydrogenase family protein subunit M [Cryobacterium sp.]|nr:xanthine dehydrogenase family protein subunit M [Oligoflexia bacterium]